MRSGEGLSRFRTQHSSRTCGVPVSLLYPKDPTWWCRASFKRLFYNFYVYNTSTIGLLLRLHEIIVPIIFTGSCHHKHQRASRGGDRQAVPSWWKMRRDTSWTSARLWQLTEVFQTWAWELSKVLIISPFPFYFFLSKCSHKENTADWLTPNHKLLERPGFHTTLSLFSLNGIHRKETNYCIHMYPLNKRCV